MRKGRLSWELRLHETRTISFRIAARSAPLDIPCQGHQRSWTKNENVCYMAVLMIQHLKYNTALIHWGRVTHICVGNLTIIGWLVAWSAPSHYLNQYWNSVDWTPRNKLQWNVNRNFYICNQENPFENVVWKMPVILSRPQYVKYAIRCLYME